jgi:hypothetical protein
MWLRHHIRWAHVSLRRNFAFGSFWQGRNFAFGSFSRVLRTNRLALRLLATILQRFPKTRGNANYRRKSARCILF